MLQIVLLAAMAGLLLRAAWGDLATRTIPNWLNLTIAGAGLVLWLTDGTTPIDLALHVAIALAVFLVFTGAFAFGMMGGGDVKMLGALALWLPFEPLMRMLMGMAVLGGVVTLVFLVRHKLRKMPGRPEIPYGVAIAIAGLWEVGQVGERYLYHFG